MESLAGVGRMRILYISYDGLTDALGQSQILAYQKNICSKEIEVSILSFEKAQVYAKLGDQVQATCHQAGIRWIPLPYTKTPPLLSTLWDLRKAWKKIVQLQKETPFDIVHCRGYISALLGEEMKGTFGTPFIFDMRGWWPDEKKESGMWSSAVYWPVYAYFKKKEKDFFRHADEVVSLTEKGKHEIITQKWQVGEKIGVISTCTDLRLFQPIEEGKKIERKVSLGFPPHAKILVYSGALGGNYPLSDIFLFLNSFLHLSPSHHCLILSKDPLPENIALPERTVMTSVRYAEVGELLAMCDAGLIYYTQAYSNIGRCPTKLGEYWASGLIAFSPSGIGDLDALFQTYPAAGVCVPNWTHEEIVASFSVLSQPVDKKALYQAAQDFFSLEKGITFYRNLYLKLAS